MFKQMLDEIDCRIVDYHKEILKKQEKENG